jgi:hypothetical protein
LHSGFDSGNGEMQAWLPRGKVYSGQFAQLRAQLDTNTEGTYFIAWSYPKWADDPWYGKLPAAYTGVNTAKVMARLESPEHSLLRCKFELRRPDAGLAGGASGQCQIAEDQSIIDVELPSAARE